jgi:RHS repeat-associated protein
LPFPLSNIPPFLGTRAVVEGTTVVESYDFDPWGLLLPGRSLLGPTREGFTGKEQDGETGLDYFGARYYMPALGRWTAVDLLFEKHLEWSPYNYVLNNPLALIDPDGRQERANGFMNLSHRDLQYLQTNAPALAAGRMQATLTADLEFSRNIDELAGAGARAYGTLFEVGASLTPADGLVSTGADFLRGDLSLANTALNFMPGPSGGAMRRGLTSEARVLNDLGEVKNTVKFTTSEGTTIPDFQNARQVGEVKDAVTVSNTRQIRAQREVARASGREHVIVTGSRTRVTTNAASGSTVKRREDLGPREDRE